MRRNPIERERKALQTRGRARDRFGDRQRPVGARALRKQVRLRAFRRTDIDQDARLVGLALARNRRDRESLSLADRNLLRDPLLAFAQRLVSRARIACYLGGVLCLLARLLLEIAPFLAHELAGAERRFAKNLPVFRRQRRPDLVRHHENFGAHRVFRQRVVAGMLVVIRGDEGGPVVLRAVNQFRYKTGENLTIW